MWHLWFKCFSVNGTGHLNKTPHSHLHTRLQPHLLPHPPYYVQPQHTHPRARARIHTHRLIFKYGCFARCLIHPISCYTQMVVMSKLFVLQSGDDRGPQQCRAQCQLHIHPSFHWNCTISGRRLTSLELLMSRPPFFNTVAFTILFTAKQIKFHLPSPIICKNSFWQNGGEE